MTFRKMYFKNEKEMRKWEKSGSGRRVWSWWETRNDTIGVEVETRSMSNKERDKLVKMM